MILEEKAKKFWYYIDNGKLYLSKYIIRNKLEYYNLFQETRKSGDFEDWIIYILVGIEEMAVKIY